MSNKWFYVKRRIARGFKDIGLICMSRQFWKRMLMACDSCGALVGMNTTISRHGSNCDPCHEGFK